MSEPRKAKEPFRFYTRMHFFELTGLRAANLSQLLSLIKEVPDSSIYHHTHSFLQQHQYLSPEPANDFAYWIAEVVGEEELGERLSNIDTIQFSSIPNLRKEIVQTIEGYLEENPLAKLKFARPGGEFHFIKSISFIIPTNYLVYDLREFAQALQKVTVDSIYFHIFEAHLRLQKKTNDFSFWVETSIGDKKLADRISKLDPYTYTHEDLRKVLIRIVEQGIIG